MAYATNTNIPIERTKGDIEHIIVRYGASGFASAWMGNKSLIEFTFNGRKLRFVLELPDPKSREFTHTLGRELERHPDDARKQWEQACKSHWRALLLCIKAKLEAVESGITTFEVEFMPYMVLPGGKTAGEHVRPMIEQAYASGKVPAGLLTFEASK